MRFILFAFALLVSTSGFTQTYYLFIGTYTNTNSKSRGVYVYRFDAATGNATPVSNISTENPSYLALTGDGKFLYAVNESNGGKGGVSAFAFDKTSGQLKFLDRQSSGGDDPCYVAVDSHRKWAMVANYSGGSLSALPIRADGSLGALTQTIQHTGAGPDKQRQEKAHVHSTVFTPDEHYLLAADLGLDKISIYRFNPSADNQPLTAAKDSAAQVAPGAGPRHIAFHPHKPYAYLMTELGGAVYAFHYNEGRLDSFQHISSHPGNYTGDIGSADIHVSPDGNFLYASNRGDANSIAIYSVDKTSGKLTIKGFQPTLGRTPRNFMIDPTGHWLLVANQKTDNVVIFRIDPVTGLLKDTGRAISVPAPVCLKTGPLAPAR